MTSPLVPYDPGWPGRFEGVAEELHAHGDPSWLIEHIGSTAIPGMPAKPIIDVAVRIRDAADFEKHRPALEAIGWACGSGVRSHPVMLFAENGIRTRIAHFFEAGEWDAVNQRILRDWLRVHPAEATTYAEVKLAAAESAAQGQGDYNSGKTAVIQQIVDRARFARGLPSVPVSDKSGRHGEQHVKHGDPLPM